MHTQIPVVFFTQSGVPGEVTDVLASSCGPVAVCTQAMEHIGQLSCSPLCCGHLSALQHYTGRFLLHSIMHICLLFSMTQACFCMQVCTSIYLAASDLGTSCIEVRKLQSLLAVTGKTVHRLRYAATGSRTC